MLSDFRQLTKKGSLQRSANVRRPDCLHGSTCRCTRKGAALCVRIAQPEMSERPGVCQKDAMVGGLMSAVSHHKSQGQSEAAREHLFTTGLTAAWRILVPRLEHGACLPCRTDKPVQRPSCQASTSKPSCTALREVWSACNVLTLHRSSS